MHRPRTVLGAWLCLAAIPSLGVVRGEFATTGESLLAKQDPTSFDYHQSVDHFGR